MHGEYHRGDQSGGREQEVEYIRMTSSLDCIDGTEFLGRRRWYERADIPWDGNQTDSNI